MCSILLLLSPVVLQKIFYYQVLFIPTVEIYNKKYSNFICKESSGKSGETVTEKKHSGLEYKSHVCLSSTPAVLRMTKIQTEGYCIHGYLECHLKNPNFFFYFISVVSLFSGSLDGMPSDECGWIGLGRRRFFIGAILTTHKWSLCRDLTLELFVRPYSFLPFTSSLLFILFPFLYLHLSLKFRNTRTMNKSVA